MKMKKLFLGFVALTSSVGVFAQYEGTYFDQRIGHGSDSIEVRQNVALFSQFMESKEYLEAYKYWSFLMEKAPIARLDTYTNGATMLGELIKMSPDKETKTKYLNELMGLYDTRLKNAELLNQCADIRPKTTRGPVLCRKAFDYAIYADGVYDDYSLNKAYNNFTEGINLVNEDPSIEIEAFVLNKYFETSYNRYQADNDGFREQFVNDYILCRDVCEKMLAKASETTDTNYAKSIVDYYDPTYNWVNGTFAYSQAADSSKIIPIYELRVEEKKNDLAYLKSAIRVLQDNYLDDTEIYFKASKYAYNIKPEYYSAIGVAASYVSENNMDEALKYYNQAVELSNDSIQKADISYEIANVLGRKGMLDKAEPYLAQAESFSPLYKGKCDLYRARRDASVQKFDSAIAYANKAGTEDPSIYGTAQRLSQEIKEYQVNWEKWDAERKEAIERQRKLEEEQARLRAQEEARRKAEQQAAAQAARNRENAAQRQARERQNAAARAEYDRRMAEYRRQKAAYDAQVAKQKRLDDFWRGR